MDNFNRWLTLLANLGVVAGLIILAFEVNQNTKATVAGVSSEIYNQSLDFFALAMDNQIIAEASYKRDVGEELTAFEQNQLWWHQYYNLRILESIFLQYKRGYLEQREWDRYARILRIRLATDPLAQDVWERRAYSWTEDFKAEVARIRQAPERK